MTQAPTDGMNLLDPLGFWKSVRDTNLDSWSKFMIEVVNSDAYAQATGTALAQALGASQPFRQALEKTMTQTLGMLNMPSREEVTTLAGRLVNVEMRLDDLDAKLSATQKALQQTMKDSAQETLAGVTRELKAIEAQLTAIRAGLVPEPKAANAAPAPTTPPKKQAQEGPR